MKTIIIEIPDADVWGHCSKGCRFIYNEYGQNIAAVEERWRCLLRYNLYGSADGCRPGPDCPLNKKEE